MAKNYLAIDFGSQNIKIAVGNLHNEIFTIEKLDMINTPANSYLDGKILMQDKLINAIRELIEKNSIKSKEVAITLNSSNIIIRELILPSVNTKEMDSMIRYEILQQLPIDMDQFIIEYRILEEFEEDHVKKNRIFIAAVPKFIVEGFFSLIKDLDLKPVSMNINPNALSRLIMNKSSINNNVGITSDTIGLLDFGAKIINISIISNGHLAFSRTINQGGKELDVSIAETLGIDLIEAEQLKMKLNLNDEMDDKNSQYQGAIIIINRWLQDIQRMLQFYDNRSTTKVSRLFIYGGITNIKGLAEYAKATFNLPVETISGISSIKLSKGFDVSGIDIKNYLNAIGAIPKRR